MTNTDPQCEHFLLKMELFRLREENAKLKADKDGMEKNISVLLKRDLYWYLGHCAASKEIEGLKAKVKELKAGKQKKHRSNRDLSSGLLF